MSGAVSKNNTSLKGKNIANNLVMSNFFVNTHTHRLTTPPALFRLIKERKRRTKREQRTLSFYAEQGGVLFPQGKKETTFSTIIQPLQPLFWEDAAVFSRLVCGARLCV